MSMASPFSVPANRSTKAAARFLKPSEEVATAEPPFRETGKIPSLVVSGGGLASTLAPLLPPDERAEEFGPRRALGNSATQALQQRGREEEPRPGRTSAAGEETGSEPLPRERVTGHGSPSCGACIGSSLDLAGGHRRALLSLGRPFPCDLLAEHFVYCSH